MTAIEDQRTVTDDGLVTDDTLNPTVGAIRHHYEVSNEFYRLLLGESMMYSGGYWNVDENHYEYLDLAQYRKLDRFAELAGVRPGSRVLDVGCGWGTMIERAAVVHGAGEAVGVTLSRTQADWIEAKGNPRIKVRVESWEDHAPPEPYDALFCISALEHFVLANLPPHERVKRYRTLFRKCASMLTPGGRMVIHTMTVDRPPLERALIADLKFLLREEFQGCHTPHLYELTDALEGVFEIIELRQERETFGRACRVWLTRLAERRDEAVAMEGEEVVARFERYLDIFAYMFELGYFNNFRIVMTRREKGGNPR
jgi:cyclopropane-fatty-acyl-phospholipid synthase